MQCLLQHRLKCSVIEERIGEETNNYSYREAVGCLMYLAVATRPDIAFAVSYVSQFLENRQRQDWEMVKRIFKYLNGTTKMGIEYTGMNHLVN